MFSSSFSKLPPAAGDALGPGHGSSEVAARSKEAGSGAGDDALLPIGPQRRRHTGAAAGARRQGGVPVPAARHEVGAALPRGSSGAAHQLLGAVTRNLRAMVSPDQEADAAEAVEEPAGSADAGMAPADEPADDATHPADTQTLPWVDPRIARSEQHAQARQHETQRAAAATAMQSMPDIWASTDATVASVSAAAQSHAIGGTASFDPVTAVAGLPAAHGPGAAPRRAMRIVAWGLIAVVLVVVVALIGAWTDWPTPGSRNEREEQQGKHEPR